MKVPFLPERLRNDHGYTLTELLAALSVTALVALLALSTLVFFNRVNTQAISGDTQQFDREYRRIYTYLQKQLEHSEKIYIRNGRVYLQDMESYDDDPKKENPKRYYDYYEAHSPEDYLYRIKTEEATLNPIGSGEKSQLGIHVKGFSLTAERDAAGAFTGLFRMQVLFENEGEEKTFEAAMVYPAGKANIIQK